MVQCRGKTKSHLIINGLLWAQERIILGHVPLSFLDQSIAKIPSN